MSKMIAYHGDPELKASVVAEVVGYRPWEGSGPSVRYMLQSNNYSLSEPRWGIPRLLTRLQDHFFENLRGLRGFLHATWTKRYFDAIPVGADLSLVGWQFLHWLVSEHIVLADSADVEIQALTVQTRACLAQAAEVLLPLTRGEPVDELAASAARTAAIDVVRPADALAVGAGTFRTPTGAARTAALVAFLAPFAASCAAEAADAAEAVNHAADAVAFSADLRTGTSYTPDDADYAARDAAYEAQSAKLLELLAAAQIPAAA